MKEKIKKLPPPHVRRGALSLEEPFRLQVFVVEEGIDLGAKLLLFFDSPKTSCVFYGLIIFSGLNRIWLIGVISFFTLLYN